MAEKQTSPKKTTSQPPATPEPLPTSVKPNKKPMIVMGVVTILSLLVSGYLYYQNTQLKQQISQVQVTPSPAVVTPSPTANPTANWKTYTSEILSFSVKYPDSWYLTKCNDSGETALLNKDIVPQCVGEPFEPIHFISSLGELTVQESIEGLTPEFEFTPRPQISGIDVEHQKYLVEKVQPAPGPESFIQIYATLENGIFRIDVFDSQYELIADQILSTLQLLQ